MWCHMHHTHLIHFSKIQNTYMQKLYMQGRQKELTKVAKRLVKVTHPTGVCKEGTEVKYNKTTSNNE